MGMVIYIYILCINNIFLFKEYIYNKLLCGTKHLLVD